MSKSTSTIIWSTVIVAVIGAAGAGILASKRQSTVTETQKDYLASMVVPANLLTSPRTYNQTLAESIDTATLTDSLTKQGLPVTAVKFDVLPDSFNLQTTTSVTRALSDQDATALAADLTAYVQTQSSALTKGLLADSTAQAKVVHTKTLPAEASLNQRPATAIFFGALAGALLGLFIGLALTDRRE